jgi:hypothetical protein
VKLAKKKAQEFANILAGKDAALVHNGAPMMHQVALRYELQKKQVSFIRLETTPLALETSKHDIAIDIEIDFRLFLFLLNRIAIITRKCS